MVITARSLHGRPDQRKVHLVEWPKGASPEPGTVVYVHPVCRGQNDRRNPGPHLAAPDDGVTCRRCVRRLRQVV